MKKAWLKSALLFVACFFLIGYGVCFAQSDEGEQEAEQTQEAEETQEMEESQEAEQPADQGMAAQEEPAQQPAETRAGELPPPLEAEMVVAEHWSKNPYPRTIAAGSRVHVVERGDTLWDIAGRYYNNPFLWPQIWEANDYIPNAHWIYPGDPIVIPPLTPVTEEQIAQETAVEPIQEMPEEEPTEGVGPEIAPPEEREYPIALDSDLYCSGFILRDVDDLPMRIVGNEENIDKVSLSIFDVVYINRGEADGVSPGDEFTVLHRVRTLEHPIDLHHLGDYVIQTGRIKVVATQQHTSTAQVTYSCDASLVGDAIVPFEPKESPVFTEMPPVDRFSLEGPNAKGYVIHAKDDLSSLGLGHELLIDLGAREGINVGTRLILYRPQTENYEDRGFERDLPRRVLGEMIVFDVRERTATGRIIQSYDYVTIGDRVEIR